MRSEPLPPEVERLLQGPLAAGELRSLEPLARHSQFQVGGPAQWYWGGPESGLLREVAAACAEAGFELTVLGAGSNALILDGGIRGLVVQLPQPRAVLREPQLVELGGGSMLPRAAFDTAYRGLGGIAFGVGIPGTAGAAAAGNAGAFGGEICNWVERVEFISPRGERRELEGSQLEASYRSTALLEPGRRGSIVTRVWLRLEPWGAERARAEVTQLMAARKQSQPVGVRSLGSTFKNPAGEPAGRLLEACGLKGYRIGQAQVSPRHANFICNLGGASANEVLALAAEMRHRVQQRFGVELQLEIVPLGSPI